MDLWVCSGQMAKRGYVAPGDPVKMAKAIVDTFEAERAAPPGWRWERMSTGTLRRYA